MAELPFVIEAVEKRENIESLILKEIKMEFLDVLQQLNMIQTEALI